MRSVPHCNRCDRDHWNVVPCEKVVAQERKRAPEHIVRPGATPWGAGFDYFSSPVKLHKARNPNTPPRKDA